MLMLCFACKNSQNEASKVLPPSTVSMAPFQVKNIGDTLDVFNGVYVIYNKKMNNTSGRHLAQDGYNLGLKWQCVEFVKRYYYEALHHKMPNSYGHAKDFYNPLLKDNQLNLDRNLMQFSNGSSSKPKVNDLIVFKPHLFNQFGHVGIISKVEPDYIEVVQQNMDKDSREKFELFYKNNKWTVDNRLVLGWLRKPSSK